MLPWHFVQRWIKLSSQVFITFTFNPFDLSLPLLEPDVNEAAFFMSNNILEDKLVFNLMAPIRVIYDVAFPEAFTKLWIIHYSFSQRGELFFFFPQRGHWK